MRIFPVQRTQCHLSGLVNFTNTDTTEMKHPPKRAKFPNMLPLSVWPACTHIMTNYLHTSRDSFIKIGSVTHQSYIWAVELILSRHRYFCLHLKSWEQSRASGLSSTWRSPRPLLFLNTPARSFGMGPLLDFYSANLIQNLDAPVL